MFNSFSLQSSSSSMLSVRNAEQDKERTVNKTFNRVACLEQIHSKFQIDNNWKVLLIEGHSDSVFLPRVLKCIWNYLESAGLKRTLSETRLRARD